MMNKIDSIANENPAKCFFSTFSLRSIHADILEKMIIPMLFTGKTNVLSIPGISNAFSKKNTEQ